MTKKIAKIVVGLPVEGPFDYAVCEDFQKKIATGMRVLVIFNRRKMVGYVVGFANRSSFSNLNPILSLLDQNPVLNKPSLDLAIMLSKHYGCSLGEAIEAMLPVFLRKKKAYAFERAGNGVAGSLPDHVPLKELVTDQSLELRWEILLPQIQKAIEAKKSVLFLVPENRMVKSLEQRIRSNIDCEMLAMDKKLSAKNEEELWKKMISNEPKFVMGTRSAVFSPLKSLGLIILADEENRAYKQEQSPYYHACEVAQMRAKVDKTDLIIVSSAPSAETWQQFKGGNYTRIQLKSKSVSEMKLVDLSNFNPQKTSKLSFPLQSSIEKTLKEQGKVLIFMNRKGFFTMTSCNACGYVLKCERCDVNLTYLFEKKQMVCKHCNFTRDLPSFCPSCKGAYLRSVGMGVEKLESEVSRLYPLAKVGSFDKDSKSYPHKADIVIATQAVLGYQVNVNVDLVGIISFDAELNHFDFRSAQRAFALLARLRQMAQKILLVQTSLLDNYTLRAAMDMNYAKFYREELTLRKEIGLPPFKRLVYIISRGKDQETVYDYSQKLFYELTNLLKNPREISSKTFSPKDIEITESHPDVFAKLRDNFRFSIMLKGPSLKNLLVLIKAALKKKRGNRSIFSAVIVDY